MKQKRWWPMILLGSFLFLPAKSIATNGAVHGIDNPLPWLVGMIPFVVILLGRRLYCQFTGTVVGDEELRFFCRAWNTTLFVYIILEATFYFRALVLVVFGKPLYLVFDYNFTLVHLFTTLVYCVFGFLIVGILRVLIWPKSISLRGFSMAIISTVISSVLFYVLVFVVPLAKEL